MTTTYGIEVFQVGRSDCVQELKQAVALELETLGLHRSVAVAVVEGRPAGDAPQVGVFLGSALAKSDDDVIMRMNSALAAGTVIIPVVSELVSFAKEVPSELAFSNGIEWRVGGDARSLVRVLLEELGIEERQRRVFLSHRREDGLGAAEQLHDKLTHANFLPFIDRFSIRKGQDVQKEIANALEYYAFLLLLETPQAHNSNWVFDEVDYALSHTMGILIVSWPDDPKPVPGSIGLPRLVLTKEELTTDQHGYSTLTDAGLERVISKVEESHALALVRRRRMIVKSIEESAQSAGVDSCVPLRDWRLLVKQGSKTTVVGTMPRLPTAGDLQAIDKASISAGASSQALLVHSARQLSAELKDHLQWVAGDRNLDVIPENAIGGWW